MAADGTNLRTLLKTRTAAAHQRLDTHPAMAGLTSAGLSIAQYQRLLQTLAALYLRLEPLLDAAAEQLDSPLGYADRHKLPALQRDLAVFALPMPQPIELHVQLTLDTLPAYAGVLYVVEGSTLGGQLIARALQRHLGLGPENGAAFYAGYGAQTGLRWQALVAFLDQLPQTTQAQTLAVDAALQTFALFEQSLQASLVDA